MNQAKALPTWLVEVNPAILPTGHLAYYPAGQAPRDTFATETIEVQAPSKQGALLAAEMQSNRIAVQAQRKVCMAAQAQRVMHTTRQAMPMASMACAA